MDHCEKYTLKCFQFSHIKISKKVYKDFLSTHWVNNLKKLDKLNLNLDCIIVYWFINTKTIRCNIPVFNYTVVLKLEEKVLKIVYLKYRKRLKLVCFKL